MATDLFEGYAAAAKLARFDQRGRLAVDSIPAGNQVVRQLLREEKKMAKYLIQANYSAEGVRGLMKEGAAGRRDQLQDILSSLGGSLEAFYYAFGSDDVVAIIDVEDHVTTAALSLAVNASGAVSIRTTVLLSPEEMDEARGKTISYRPPGG